MLKISRRTILQALAASAAAPFLPARTTDTAESVEESGFIPIGGIDQWVAIQGEDNVNPVILFLHGGPAEAESPFLKEFGPWEHDFTVVNWDQRGSGKTYGKNGPSTPGMTVDRMAEDAGEVAEYGRNKLSKSKLVLVGHSWGALLGFYAVAQRPDLFYALLWIQGNQSTGHSSERANALSSKKCKQQHQSKQIHDDYFGGSENACCTIVSGAT